jgi:8-oxo-dGTP pyrophosphatase MutT (NUDIX family)
MTDIDTNVEASIKKKYCINCGKLGHYNKECTEPTTSAGMILFKFNNDNINYVLKKDISMNYFIDKFNKLENKKIVLTETKNILDNINDGVLNFLKENISFLLIQRRQSLGYIEFVRGRYDVNDLELLIHLFNQMTSNEIKYINDNKDNFDTLWDDLWNIHTKDAYLQIEYDASKIKYNELCSRTLLDELLNCKPLYDEPEWGFPKGRRNYRENNIMCAKREIYEETNFVDGDYNILNGIYPLVEVMTGTNEKKYKHIYYIGVCDNNKGAYMDESNEMQHYEIGNIGWYNYNECMELLRPYHIEKRRLLSITFSFVVGQILKYNKYIRYKKIELKKNKNNQLNI